MTMSLVGQPVDRVDGAAKVTGAADYAADRLFPNLAYAVPVMTEVGCGVVEAVDPSRALAAPGVLTVLHKGNIRSLYRTSNSLESQNKVGEIRPLFEDSAIHYFGQFVALAVADTLEQAQEAARLVAVRWRETPERLAVDFSRARLLNGEHQKAGEKDAVRGTPDTALASAPVSVDQTYTTPVEVHVPLEIHASVAHWEGDRLHSYETTQWVVGQRISLAQMLGVPVEEVTVYSHFIGGGFGSKLFLWPHSVAAAVAARAVGRPVKLVLDRRWSFTTVGHRPSTIQRLRIGANRDGKLVALEHHSVSQTSMVDEFLEDCPDTSRSLYSCPNLGAYARIVAMNVGTPTSMRAPGAAPGTFALESAMDELAHALHLDPIELRRRNFPATDESEKRPWSSNRILDCYRIAAERFGWSRRNPAPRSMRDGKDFLGWGFAAASWDSPRSRADVKVELLADGTARLACATQDIGTGTYTVFAQVAAASLALPIERVRVILGQSNLPPGPISGGSQVTATVVPAITEACRKAIASLKEAAGGSDGVLSGEDPESIGWETGELVGPRSGRRVRFEDVLAARRLASVEGSASARPGEERKAYTFRSFGAHCVEVRWDPELVRLRVERVVTAIDAGRVINLKTARSQVEGAIVMGVGMALLEESVYDPRTGRVVTANLADYRVPVNADAPAIDVTFIDRPDPHSGELGVKGIGEIGITGIAAAIANAAYHATGTRFRELPISVERLLG